MDASSAKRVLKRGATHAVLMAGVVLVAFPFVWMILTSCKTAMGARSIPPRLLPKRFLAGNYREIWQTGSFPGNVVESVIVVKNYVRAWRAAPFGRYFINTTLVAACVTLGVLVTSIMAGYAFARFEFFGKQAIFLLFLATMMVPFEVILVPNYLIVDAARGALGGLLSPLFGPETADCGLTYLALVVPWSANVFSIFLLRQFFQSLPQDYFDAAQIDGCGHWRFLWQVAVPMVSPALVTVAIFAFLGSWNSLLWPLVISNAEETRVLQVGLSIFITEEDAQMNLLMAAATFTILPMVLLYVAAQRQFIEGVTGVGLKQ